MPPKKFKEIEMNSDDINKALLIDEKSALSIHKPLFYLKILERFQTNFAAHPQKIQDELNNNNPEQAFLLMHSLNGVAGNSHLPQLQKIAASLEKKMKNEPLSNELFDQLTQISEQTLDAIKDYIEKFSDSQTNHNQSETAPESDADNWIADLQEHKILLVDDNDFNLKIAAQILEQFNLNTVCVESGQACLDSLTKEEFDMILLDIHLDDMEGFEVSRHIRQELQLSALPIIAWSADDSEQHKQKCLNAGMNDLLGKPFNKESLLKILKQWIIQVKVQQTADK